MLNMMIHDQGDTKVKASCLSTVIRLGCKVVGVFSIYDTALYFLVKDQNYHMWYAICFWTLRFSISHSHCSSKICLLTGLRYVFFLFFSNVIAAMSISVAVNSSSWYSFFVFSFYFASGRWNSISIINKHSQKLIKVISILEKILKPP